MKAVVLHEYGGPEKLHFEDKVPEPQISGNTVLIATAGASVNPMTGSLRTARAEKIPAVVSRDFRSRRERRRSRRGRKCKTFQDWRPRAGPIEQNLRRVGGGRRFRSHSPARWRRSRGRGSHPTDLPYRRPTCAHRSQRAKGQVVLITGALAASTARQSIAQRKSARR